MLLTGWRQLSIWRLNIIMWSLFGVLFFLRAILHLTLLPALSLSLFHLVFCLLFTGLLIMSYRRLEQKTVFGIGMAAWIIILSLLATVIQSAAAHVLVSVTGWKHPSWSALDLWLMRMMFFWLVYMTWSLLYFWLRAEQAATEQVKKAAEALAEAQRMELQLLRSQLDPHFLFNALNGISTVVQKESPAASSMVRELADYLRYSLDHRYDTLVPLAHEIDAMMAYLQIEQARFDEELHVEITTDEASRRREVPCYILLPLVENAVKHSSQNCEPPWNVTISAETDHGGLIIEVRNTGTLASRNDTASGVGLDVLKRRLELHYPERHDLSLREVNGSVCARLLLEGEPCSV